MQSYESKINQMKWNAMAWCLRGFWRCLLNYMTWCTSWTVQWRSDLCPSSWDSTTVKRSAERLLCLSVPPRLCSMLASVDCGLLCSPLLLVWSRKGDVILQSNPVIILWKHLLLTLLTRLCPSSYRGILHHFVGFLQEAKHHWIYCRCIVPSIMLNHRFNPMKFTLKLGFNDIKMYHDHPESFRN